MTLPRDRSDEPGPGGAVLEELDALLGEVAEAAASTASVEDFAAVLLRSAAKAARAEGAALWGPGPSGEWRAEFRYGAVPAPNGNRGEAVGRVAESGEVRRVGRSGDMATPGESSVVASMSGRVLELVLGSRADDRGEGLVDEIARSFAEVGAEFFARRELESLRVELGWLRRCDAFSRAVHRSVELGPTAFAIANDGRALVGCDRLTVARAGDGRVLAVSGVELPDRRSPAVRHLERLAREVSTAGARYWRCRADGVAGEGGVASAGLRERWREYLGLVPGVAADVVVLGDEALSPGSVGVLIAEWFEGVPEGSAGRVAAVEARAEPALRSSLEATPGAIEAAVRVFVAPLKRRHLPKTVVAVAAVAACAAALTFVRTEFVVAARGQLVPERTREIFAPSDGVVRRVAVRHGDRAGEGGTLLVLSAPLLDLERERIAGELATAQERVRALQAERATGRRGPGEADTRPAQLAADEKEFAERVASLERQLGIVNRQIEELTVRSPLDGVVLTWEADERLEDRPVRRGQRLLTVAAPEGGWLLELSVPDRATSHLLRARKELGPALAIDYRLATEPQVTHHAVLGEVALSTEPDGEGRPSLRASARLARDEVPVPRPGATVVANIRCGRRALGYVWFHEIYEALLTHVFF